MKILTIDGGGIRGIIPAIVLQELESETGQKTRELFDAVAGTSTGGILACGIAEGVPADEIVNIYLSNAEKIFDKRFLGNIAGPKYVSSGLKEVLQEEIGDRKLSKSPIDLTVPCFDIASSSPFVFHSRTAEHNALIDRPLWEVAFSTSVAPTYFAPHKLQENHALIDGGVFANNPAMVAVAEYGEPDLLVSLGTGEYDEVISYENAQGWGAIKWIQPVIDACMDGGSDTVHRQCDKLVENYYRLQTPLDIAAPEMDNISDENLRNLEMEGYQITEKAPFKEVTDGLC